MEKKGKIILGIVLAIVLIFGVMYISIVSSKTIAAQINVEFGTVLVNGEQITESMELGERDTVETLGDGKATIILYESIVVSLEPNTKITIDDLKKDHPKLGQTSGETWNTVTKLVGIEEYTISSGNSVASVRGTEFVFTIDGIVLFEGRVDYEIDNEIYSLLENIAMERQNGVMIKRILTDEERVKMTAMRLRTIKHLKLLRESEIDKHPRVMGMVKNTYDLTDEDIREGLREADDGIIDIEEIERKVPVDIASVHKVVEITKEIRKINQEIKAISR